MLKYSGPNHSAQEVTWELEKEMKQKYSHLFENSSTLSFKDKIYFKEGKM